MQTWGVNLAYLAAAVCFILGLKFMSGPKRARFGNALASAGMLLAVLATLLKFEIASLGTVAAGLVLGAGIGAGMAATVKMTAMPQMVGLLNGFGGIASALVGGAEFFAGKSAGTSTMVPLALSILIGGITFTGSLVAFGKLQGLVSARPLTYPLQQPLNFLLGAVAIGLAVWLVLEGRQATAAFYMLAGVAGLLGFLFVLPIGGADMPVVISLLNSYSGLAACAAGFVLLNNALIISGALVGAAGFILTAIMCKAMNRSLFNVLFSAFGKIEGSAASAGTGREDRRVRSGVPEEAAMVFETANKVIFVPGYGMAVAQAQHAVKELADELQRRGVEVKYAIHPVAGRMPGHMNVLLAEAQVPYDQLKEMDAINPEFKDCDAALVIGANDITNPAARNQKSSPLYGMPILDVDKAKTIWVCKRSMRPGFAGVENELYYNLKTTMLFGDAKKTVTEITAALKEL